MKTEIGVQLQAKSPKAIKLLLRLYENHLLLNAIGVRLQDKLSSKQAAMCLNEKDIKHLKQAFGDLVKIFTRIIHQYGTVIAFVANFAASTQNWAQKLVVELIDFNNGFAELSNSKGKLSSEEESQLNNWLNRLMDEIVATNEAFAKLKKASA